jgi:hypothetical protein
MSRTPYAFWATTGALLGFNRGSTWFPDTGGNDLGPRSPGTDGVKLGVGGDFHSMNDKPQQGFTRFG